MQIPLYAYFKTEYEVVKATFATMAFRSIKILLSIVRLGI